MKLIASWNGNSARTFGPASYSERREKEPVLIRLGLGNKRLATRAEIAASKAGEALQNVSKV